MKLEHLFLVIAGITLVTSLFYGFYADLLNSYSFSRTEADPLVDLTFTDADSRDNIDSMKSAVSEGSVDEDDAENQMYRELYESARNEPYSASELVEESIQSLGRQLNTYLPKGVILFLQSAVFILTLFAVLYFLRGIASR